MLRKRNVKRNSSDTERLILHALCLADNPTVKQLERHKSGQKASIL